MAIRELTVAEALYVSGGTDDIVVTAKRRHASPQLPTFSSAPGSGATGGFGGGGGAAPPPADEPASDIVVTASVNVHVKDSSHLADATAAAQNVASALSYIRDQLSSADPNAIIKWANGTKQMTASQILNTIDRTEFTITDDDFTNTNSGVGSAEYFSNGHNKDTLDYRYFDGKPQNGADGKALNDYASANYTNGQGMNGIMLHEIAHLTTPGDTFYIQSETAYKSSHGGSNTGFVGSAAWVNSEKNANDMMAAFANGVKVDISTFSPTYGYGAVSPQSFGKGNPGL